MIKLRAKQPKEAPTVGPSLADQIRAAQAAAEEFIESKVQEIKNSPDGQSLPISWLRQNIFAVHKARGCSCRCALSLMAAAEKK
jgi:hypothetical protein